MKKPFLKCKSCFRPIKNLDGTLRFPTPEEIEALEDGMNPKQICHECCNLFTGTSLLDVVTHLEGFGRFIEKIDEDNFVIKIPDDLE